MKKGIFIAFEGGEGSGKTTQIRMLARVLEAEGRDVLATKEPGGDKPALPAGKSICREIRTILLDAAHHGIMDARAEFFLFLADRAQHAANVILPAFEEGKIVLCDRFAASTFAYQFYARGVADFEFIKSNNDFASRGLVPDLTFFIDVDPEIGIKRKQKGELSRIDGEDLEFHKKVQNGFYDFFKNSKWPVARIDGTLSISDINEEIIKRTKEIITKL